MKEGEESGQGDVKRKIAIEKIEEAKKLITPSSHLVLSTSRTCAFSCRIPAMR